MLKIRGSPKAQADEQAEERADEQADEQAAEQPEEQPAERADEQAEEQHACESDVKSIRCRPSYPLIGLDTQVMKVN